MPKDVKFINLKTVVKKYMKEYKDNEYVKYNYFYSMNHDAIVVVIQLDEPIFKEDYVVKTRKCQDCESVLYFYESLDKAKCCKCGTIYKIKRYCGSCRHGHCEEGECYIRCQYLLTKSMLKDCPEIVLKKIEVE